MCLQQTFYFIPFHISIYITHFYFLSDSYLGDPFLSNFYLPNLVGQWIKLLKNEHIERKP